MFNWLFGKSDDDEWLTEVEQRLDAKEKALNESIAQKEKLLNNLTEACEQSKKEVQELKSDVRSYEQALQRNQN
jgi:uncharacterized protein YoxC